MSYFNFYRIKNPFPLFYTCVVPQPDGFDKPGRWLIFFSFSFYMRKREGPGDRETTAKSCQLWVWSPRKRTQRGDGIKINSWLKFTGESMASFGKHPETRVGTPNARGCGIFRLALWVPAVSKRYRRDLQEVTKTVLFQFWRFVQFVQHTTGILAPLTGPVKGMGNGFQTEK